MIAMVPWSALLGGMLLGLSAFLLLMLNGRVAGISGIIAGLVNRAADERWWRAVFLVGMVLAGVVVSKLGVPFPSFEGDMTASPLLLAIAGLLVGLETRWANGCTSGHGICGMGRMSRRSLIATGVFMTTAFITVFIRFHL